MKLTNFQKYFELTCLAYFQKIFFIEIDKKIIVSMGIFSFPLNSWHVHKQIFASITPLNQVYKRLFSDAILSKLFVCDCC